MASDGLDPRTAIFVVSGTQGAGKTTVSELLARRFARGVHIPADTLQKMILSGREWPAPSQTTVNTPDYKDEAVRQLRLRLRNACLLARSFLDAGFTAVIDDIVVGSRLDQAIDELSGVPWLFVIFSPSAEEVRARERDRGTELWREWEWLTLSIPETTKRTGLWLDTTGQTPEETVDEIMRRAWAEAPVEPQQTTAGGAR